MTRHGGFAYIYHDEEGSSHPPLGFMMKKIEPTSASPSPNNNTMNIVM